MFDLPRLVAVLDAHAPLVLLAVYNAPIQPFVLRWRVQPVDVDSTGARGTKYEDKISLRVVVGDGAIVFSSALKLGGSLRNKQVSLQQTGVITTNRCHYAANGWHKKGEWRGNKPRGKVKF